MVPSDLKISNLRPGEVIQYVLHRHWITLVYTAGYVVFMLFATLALINYNASIESFIPGSGALYSLAIIGFLMCFTLFIYVYWIDNELDFFIITNERIIGIEQLTFLNRTVRECSLDQVQEVNGFANGLLANLLNFGAVTIRTASDTSDFTMQLAPEPLEHARIILNIIQEFKGRHREHGQHTEETGV